MYLTCMSYIYCCLVHDETQCHIHFPDSNRLPHGGEKSDQVSITGPVASVELARKKIRVSTESEKS